ncbi:MAG: FAD-dependent oxidoreductase [Candidatus Aminicenantes bacterium]|nr:FAD-dependent oxidoreductase [Candidatus Aminicenantes bacterium]
MEKITLNIDGKQVTARPGQTILEVIQENRLAEIPTLCHDPKLPPYGSCYLCVVEVEGIAKLIPSCSSPVADKMVVHTDNPRIRAARKTALELLLSNHYADCLAPCQQTCPAGVDVQGYIALIAMGKEREAVRLIKRTNPLPLVCGRVCVRECEVACRRNRVDERVGIDYLKRYATDIDIEDPWTPALPPANGKKVAVVGGGPAGLTCAYYLILKGYAVTLFEKAPALGGMLRYGIPEYRLPKELLDKEIGWITGLGVTLKTSSALGRDFTLDDLKKQGYDSIFLAFGAQKAKGMRLAGEDQITGVLGGIDFLWQLQGEKKPEIYGTVVVVGGGNTAIDAARTALRLGADKVTLLYRRTRKEMPAHSMEIEAALEEGVELVQLSAPTELLQENGRLQALTCIRMELGEPDASGRRSPVPLANSEYRLPCDFVISAIGQDVDLCGLQKDPRLQSTRHNTPVYDEGTFATSIPGVFVGGDMATGPAVAIDAIAQGRRAAESIDQYVRNGKAEARTAEFISRKEAFGDIPDSDFADFAKIAKEKMPELPAASRGKTFEEVERGFTPQQAQNEAGRCLECGCSAYFDCALRKHAVDFGVDITKFVGEVRKYKVDKGHPFITLDPNKCIACGRCVRTCSEVLQVSALGFVYRGFKSVVRPSMEKKLLETNCISCGNCIAACPTGAIAESLPFAKPGPWAARRADSICHFCSVGCVLQYKIFDRDTFAVAAVNGDSHNKGYLCHKGRFGYRYMLDKGRLLAPRVKKGNGLREASWDEALTLAAARIQAVIQAHGTESVAVFASPRMANEELYLLQKWVRSGWQTNMIGSFSNMFDGHELDALDDMLGFTTSTTTMDDLAKADVILVVNAELTENNLVAELKIKEAIKRGARLVSISSSENTLSKIADLWLDPKRGSNTSLLAGIAGALIKKGVIDREFIERRCEDFAQFQASIVKLGPKQALAKTAMEKEKFERVVELLAGSPNLVIVYGMDEYLERSRDELKALGNLMLLLGKSGKPGNGLLLIRDYANAQGLLDMGCDPRWLPGFVRPGQDGIAHLSAMWKAPLERIFTPVDLAARLKKGEVKALLVFGEDPLAASGAGSLLSAVEFKLVADFFLTASAAEADVILPMSTPLESDGTYTACDRRVQRCAALLPARSGMTNLEVIGRLAQLTGQPLQDIDAAAVFREITEANPYYREVADGGFWGGRLFRETFATAGGKAHFLPLAIDLAIHSREKQPLLSSENYLRTKIKSKLVL